MSKKNDKFKELAENRVRKAIKLLKLIGNLANKRFKSKNSTDDNDFKL